MSSAANDEKFSTSSTDEETVRRSNSASGGSQTTNTANHNPTKHNNHNNNHNNNNNNSVTRSMEEQLAQAREQIGIEKAGKRKLFHSLVKLANELKRTRLEAKPLLKRQQYVERNWYEGGMWRAPSVLPVLRTEQLEQTTTYKISRVREAISLSDLFFNLVIVTAFTRVGVSVSQVGHLDFRSFLYFGVFWTVWSKESSYGTRFDTTDLSAILCTLVTCFAVLFASLSTSAPINSDDGTRIMIMAAFVAGLNCFLHIRVALTNQAKLRANHAANNNNNNNNATTTSENNNPRQGRQRSDSIASLGHPGGGLTRHVIQYAIFNIIMTALELIVWLVGILAFPVDWPYRWCIFLGGLLLAMRLPRAFLANDFHAACSRRGVLFILLLGFLLQSIVVVASEFFEYQTPTLEHYSFVGAACLLFFCIKLLYVDDSDTLAEDHALLVNRWAGFFFNVGQFCLLLSTTVMGSGLNLLTHDYLAATAALPGPAKHLVCGGFSAVLLSNFFIKSMHLKRVPTDPRNQALFIGAYIIEAVVLLAVVGVTFIMGMGYGGNSFLASLMQYDSELLFVLSGAAFVVVALSWLDEGVELTLYETAADSRSYRVHPFGIWWCLAPDVTDEDLNNAELDESEGDTARRSLSVLSPLLGSSIANMKEDFGKISSGSLGNYHSLATSGSGGT